MDKISRDIIAAGQNKNYEELEELVQSIETNKLIEIAVQKIDRADGIIFWNYVLTGFRNCDDASDKRFAVVAAVLNQLNAIEMSAKQSFEIITRLFIELPNMKNAHLVELCEYCIESLRLGDPKCSGWKDLFPELMQLINNIPKILVNGIPMTGKEYRDQLFQSIITLRWPKEILTVIANMFRELKLSKADKLIVINKLCEPLLKLDPTELPALGYQLFSLCTSASLLIVPLYSFNQYFHRHYYKKTYAEMDSDQSNYDSIDPYSDKEICEAQDTILYHLSNCSEFRLPERDIITHFRALSSNPRFVLTPFLMSALLTMCKINRNLDSTRLSSSITLHFLRSVIQNNEREKELSAKSAWSRLALDQSVVDLDKVFTILIDNSKEGADYVTPGIIGLSFILLKTNQNPQLNALGIKSLEQFVKKRYIFGAGIVNKLREFLLADQEQLQFSDCLTRLSKTCTLTLVECGRPFEEIMDFLLLIPGQHAMRIMTFLAPMAQLSTQIRDYLIDILRKSMYQADVNTRKMAVFGFCTILKQLRQNNSRRGPANLGGTQLTISGFSLASQSLLNNSKDSKRHFDTLALEIMGILRKCFNQTCEIKEMLYECLSTAVDGNPNLTPHIIQFLELHLRSYFKIDEAKLTINFDRIICEKETDGVTELLVYDQLGQLVKCVGHCIIKCDQAGLEFDTASLRTFFNTLINRIDSIELSTLNINEALTQQSNQIAQQYLNCLEALMYYVLNSNPNDSIPFTRITAMYKSHMEITETIKKWSLQLKKVSKKKGSSQNARPSSNPGAFKPGNIWSLGETCQFIETIHSETTRFAPDQVTVLQNADEFGEYTLNVAIAKVKEMISAPSYKQIKYSKSSFSNLCQMADLIFVKYVANTIDWVKDGKTYLASLGTECFRQCLTSADFLYKRKFSEFLKHVDTSSSQHFGVPIKIQSIVDNLSTEEGDDASKIQHTLLQCLEILYDYIPPEEQQSKNSYNWLLEFCKKNDIESEELGLIHKMLFTQRIKTQTGIFFEGIAMQIGEKLGLFDEDNQIPDAQIKSQFQLKSINAASAISCFSYMCSALKKEVEDVEYFITKCKSFHAKYKIGGQGEQHENKCVQLMKNTERKVCSQLLSIGRTCIFMANISLPLGHSMDSLVKILIQFYVCLANLTKHLIMRHSTIPVSYNQTKFDELVRSLGKALPLKIYGLISYIEMNIFEDNTPNEKSTGQGSKAKVARETRYIPKLVLRIENFNKFVICLDKKSKHQNLSAMLHVGTVRDFRIKTAALRKMLNETFQQCETSSDVDEEKLDEPEIIDDEGSDNELEVNDEDSSI